MLQALSGDLSASDIHMLVARLEGICRRQPSYAESLALDKPYRLLDTLASLESNESHRFRQYSRDNNLLRVLVGLYSLRDDPKAIVYCLRACYTVPDTQVPGRTDRYLTACIRVAQQPLCAHAVYPKAPLDFVNRLQFGYDELDKEQLGWVLEQFKLNGLLLSLAVQGYQQEHHRYPATLGELVSDGWLRQLPMDPFTQRDTICYRRTATSFVFYSRGPDGRDDGGTPITNPVPHRFMVYLKSRGDVVYGVNEFGETPPSSL